jgi:hypothetical protein
MTGHPWGHVALLLAWAVLIWLLSPWWVGR